MTRDPKINLSDFDPAKCDECGEDFHSEGMVSNDAGQWCEECWDGKFGPRRSVA